MNLEGELSRGCAMKKQNQGVSERIRRSRDKMKKKIIAEMEKLEDKAEYDETAEAAYLQLVKQKSILDAIDNNEK